MPLGNYGNPVHFGNVAGFLPSDVSCYVTGETPLVNGVMRRFLADTPLSHEGLNANANLPYGTKSMRCGELRTRRWSV